MANGLVQGMRSAGREVVRRAQASPENRFRREYYDDIARTGRMGAALSDRFTSGISEFSPQMAFERRVQSAQNQTRERFGRDLENLRGSQTRMGRLNTGFATEDEDRLWIESMRDLQNMVGSAALQTSGQELSRLSLLGSHADRTSERAMAARAGELYSLRDQRFQDESDKRSHRGNILGSLIGAGGTIAGALVGGPVGAAIGGGLSSLWGRGRGEKENRSRPRTDYRGY